LAVKGLDFLLLVNTVLETLELGELGDSALVDVFYALEGFVADCFLVICQNKTSEFTAPEEVLSLVFRFWQGEHDFTWIFSLWLSIRTEFELELLVDYLEIVRDR